MLEQITSLLHQLYDVKALIAWGGYAAMVFIVFAETGLFFGFFLPGDSLLVTAGILASTGLLDIWVLNLLLVPAAIIGDATGYYFGKKVGVALYSRKDSRFFKKAHVERARAFYEKHGGKTIILARFIPAVRTFAPIVAGVSGMKYSAFAAYNVIGAFLWVTGLTFLGFFLGNAIPDVEKNLLIVIGVVIFLSFLPAIWEYWKHQKGKAKKAG